MDLFFEACRNGDLPSVQRLFYENNLYLGLELDLVFRRMCYLGNLNIAKWLYGVSKIDIHSDLEAAFRWSCWYGHLNVVQWLCTLGNIDIHVADDFVYRNCATIGNSNILCWLLSIEKFPTKMVNAHAIYYEPSVVAACYNAKYKAYGVLEQKYFEHMERRIKYYKRLIRLCGKMIINYYAICERRYKYGGPGFLVSSKHFNLLAALGPQG
ncbi:MAG: hypothetical protein Hyperionvirus14_9 [Hyperionvirus sp.]|uniref:Ankyrin repeat protein n=1 Tax=Hyperionvirus sp. TaxID=2487770 RepID=A0A3G5A9I4_9VIRU|nr:MAG: hypothetical protein Hyperionvirus14_9 [Hyperionvirus sp.]